MNRTELEDRLRDLCGTETARVMEAVDEYVAASSPGPSAARYRRGSIIAQCVPHQEKRWGVRRWRVQDVVGDDYLVQALFSDGAPMYAYWDITWCEEITELEWQDDTVGRIGPDGRCQEWPSV